MAIVAHQRKRRRRSLAQFKMFRKAKRHSSLAFDMIAAPPQALAVDMIAARSQASGRSGSLERVCGANWPTSSMGVLSKFPLPPLSPALPCTFDTSRKAITGR